MKDYVNEVLEQMKDKYIAEAADFQAEKRSIRPPGRSSGADRRLPDGGDSHRCSRGHPSGLDSGIGGAADMGGIRGRKAFYGRYRKSSRVYVLP